MKIPQGMNQESVLKVIQKVSKKIANKYTFGFYEPEDIEQDAFIIAIEALEHYDPSRPLENFLCVYISNRLKNTKRNKYHRIDYKCSSCDSTDSNCKVCQKYHRRNNAKKSLMEPLDINQVRGIIDKSLSYYTRNDMEVKEILEIIDANLESRYREDYLKMRSGVQITGFRRRVIIKKINEIIRDA